MYFPPKRYAVYGKVIRNNVVFAQITLWSQSLG